MTKGPYEPYPPESIAPSEPLRVDRDLFKAYTGQEIHPQVLEFMPFGRRLVVMREEPLRMYEGVIHIPDQAQDLPASGWVISTGNSVGDPWAPGSPPLGNIPLRAVQLLGCKVLFGMYAGQALLTGDKGEDAYRSRYLIIDEGSLWGTMGAPPPALVEVPNAR